MKLETQYAVVSFCRDLTDPDATAEPVAVVLIADTPAFKIASVVGRSVSGVDPITNAFLGDVPRLVKDQLGSYPVNESTKSGELLQRLHDSLRNSLHVSRISEPRMLDIDAEQMPTLIDVALEILNEELRAAGLTALSWKAVLPPHTPTARAGNPGQSPWMGGFANDGLPAAAIWDLGGRQQLTPVSGPKV